MDISTLDAKTILTEEVIAEVFDMDSEIDRAYGLIELSERAKVLGVLSSFKEIVKAFKAEEKRLKREQKEAQKPAKRTFEPNIIDYDFEFPEYELICGSWIADMDGVRAETLYGEIIACYHPIFISNRLLNVESNKEKIELTYYKKSGNSGVWKNITIDKGVVASSTKIVQLADYGVSVTSESAKHLVKFLADIENMNTGVIPLTMSTSKLGWVNGHFMPYNNNVIFDAKDQYGDLFYSVKSSGDSEKWFDLVKNLRKSGRYEINLYLAGAFASVLVKPLKMLPFILNLWGETGQGKTVALMIGCSVWANPAESKYITDPSSTAVALERRLNVLNNLPLLIDDLSKTRDKFADGFTDLVYLLCSGKGKDRSNIRLGLETSSTWQNITMTNMERPLAVETMRGGAINRILDFEMQEGNIFEDGNKVVRTVSQNYGFAGEMFVDVLNELGFDKVQEIQEDFAKKIRKSAPDKEEKQIIPLSVLLTADKISADYVFKDGIYLDFEHCVDQLKSIDDVSENKRAYEYIMSEISINFNNFRNAWDDEISSGQIWGMFDTIGGEDYCFIHTNKFKEICSKGNISSKAFLKWADKQELLHKNNSDRKSDYLFRKRTNGVLSSFYAIKMPKEPEIEASEVSIVDDCPF